MAQKYPYKYEFASLDAIKDKEGKYADTKLYKYALLITSSRMETRHKDGAPGVGIHGFDFNFYDRGTGKNYPATGKASSFAIMTFKPVINTIVNKYKQ